jgi:NAD(P)-dependent dehydrogenase (short-subunit alcohol dehydrogenase family)
VDKKVVVITGAAEGIGRASAIKFAEQGASLVLADINEAMLAETHKLVGGDAISIKTDVTDEHACQAMIDAAVERFGRVEVLLNNAGIAGERARTGEMSTEAWNRVIAVNLNGVFFSSRAALPVMQSGGGGVIVNIASIDGQAGMATVPHYVATKHAVIGLTRNIALEYGTENIRAVAVAPGLVHTTLTRRDLTEEECDLLAQMTPLGRGAEPREIANLIAWLASDEASFITGTCHNVDGGILSGFAMPG